MVRQRSPRGCSSAGRAPRSQRGSRRFESAHLHRIFEWNVPKVQDLLGFCAVSVYFHWLIHRFIDGIYRRVIKVALGSITRASTRHPMATLALCDGSASLA